jgi:hypothetical protein
VLKYQRPMEGMATTGGVGATHRNIINNDGGDLVFDICDISPLSKDG